MRVVLLFQKRAPERGGKSWTCRCYASWNGDCPPKDAVDGGTTDSIQWCCIRRPYEVNWLS